MIIDPSLRLSFLFLSLRSKTELDVDRTISEETELSVHIIKLLKNGNLVSFV